MVGRWHTPSLIFDDIVCRGGSTPGMCPDGSVSSWTRVAHMCPMISLVFASFRGSTTAADVHVGLLMY